jgi:hypothetical protein
VTFDLLFNVGDGAGEGNDATNRGHRLTREEAARTFSETAEEIV